MSRRHWIVSGCVLLVGSLLFTFFPLFHIRPLQIGDGAQAQSGSPEQAVNSSNPAPFVEEFWRGALRRGEGVVDISTFWNAVAKDSAAAKAQFGRQVGLGGAWYFCVQGSGTIDTIEKHQCLISILGSSQKACLKLGVIVDNTVRESIGVNVSDFANSQDFNELSSLLNQRIEKEIIAPNKPHLSPGAAVSFVGCAKIRTDDDLDPLCLVPIHLQIAAANSAAEPQE